MPAEEIPTPTSDPQLPQTREIAESDKQESKPKAVEVPHPPKQPSHSMEVQSWLFASMLMILDWLITILVLFAVSGTITIRTGSDCTLMPVGARQDGDVIFGRFWWRNLALAVFGFLYLIKIDLFLLVSISHYYSEPKATVVENYSRHFIMFAILLFLIISVPLLIGTWFLAKTSIIAGRVRRYSLWGQYAWFNPLYQSRYRPPPIGEWLPSTDPSHGPENYYWVSFASIAEIRADTKGAFFVFMVFFTPAFFCLLFGSGGWFEVGVVMGLLSLACFPHLMKQSALYYHHWVMDEWARNARTGIR